jgi:hypothetical protein
VVNTRFDIAYAVSTVARYFNNPGKEHWTAVKRIFRYLKGTKHAAIVYDKNAPALLEGYMDASYASSLDDRKSVTGYIFTYCGGPVAWNSKKQQTVAASTAEAEYMAASEAAIEGIWLKHFLQELNLWQQDSVKLYEDNSACIRLAENPQHVTAAKHIELKHHFIRDRVALGDLSIAQLPTNKMLADLLTKPLQGEHFNNLRASIGMVLSPPPLDSGGVSKSSSGNMNPKSIGSATHSNMQVEQNNQ